MKLTKAQLIELLSERISESLSVAILEQTKRGLELKLENSGFDMEDFFFSDAEAAAKADMEKHYGNKMVNAKLGDKEDVKSFLDAQMAANDADVDKHAAHLKGSKNRTFNQKLVDFVTQDHRLADMRDNDPRGLLDIIALAGYKYIVRHNAGTPFIAALQNWIADLDHEFEPTPEDLTEVDPVAYRLIKRFEPIYNKEAQLKRLNEALAVLEGSQVARYYPIVFLQGEEAQETMDILDQSGEEEALKHLLQNYYGEGPERALDDEHYKGNLDHEYRQEIDGETFIMNWNYGLPYIGLTQMKMVDVPDLSGDKYDDLYGDLHGTHGELNEFDDDIENYAEKPTDQKYRQGKPNSVYSYHINLDERGLFYADVRDEGNDTVYELKRGYGEDEDNDLVEMGYMKNDNDISGLEDYLKSIRFIEPDSKIIPAHEIDEASMNEDVDDIDLDGGDLSDDLTSLSTMDTVDDVSKGYYVVPPKGDDPLWYVVDQDGDPVSGHNTEQEAEKAKQDIESDYRPTGGLSPQEAPQFGVDFKESREQRIDRLMKEAFELIKEYESMGGYPAGAEHDPSAPWNISEPEPVKKKPKQTFSLVDSNRECVILHHGGSYYAFDKNGIEPEKAEEIAIDYIGVPSEVERTEDGFETIYDASEYRSAYNLTGEAIVDYVNDNFAHLKVGDGLEAWETGSYDLVRIDQPLARELKSLWTSLSVPIS